MSRSLSRDSSLTTPSRAGSSSTTSPTPRVRVPRLVARLVTRPVVDYFAFAARPGASARRASMPRHVARLVTRLVVDYFASVARPGASARRAAHRVGSSSTTSPTSRVRLLRHVTRLVA
jgi:hypothetical protein